MVNIEIQVREVKGVFAEKVLEAALESFFLFSILIIDLLHVKDMSQIRIL